MADLTRWLRPGDLLVANDSRVFPARLLGRRQPGGGHAECLLIDRATEPPRATDENRSSGTQEWWALVRPGPRIQIGSSMDFSDPGRAPGIRLMASVLEISADGRRRVSLAAHGTSVSDAIDRLGHVPLPPYIRRPDTDEDRVRYQTIFARRPGSIAAPTAGLHFDGELLAALETAGVTRVSVTLHVGYGTFKPVTAEDTADHRVDAERWEVTPATASAIAGTRAGGGRLVAIGTTTTRALESAAGDTGIVTAGAGKTDLCMTPGYQFQAIDALLTNFHLPRSSLLMLVSAFAGRELLLAAYRDAVRREFAFYSYGDAMLVI